MHMHMYVAIGMVLEVYVKKLFLLANLTWNWSYHRSAVIYAVYFIVAWLMTKNKYASVGEFSVFSVVVCAWSTTRKVRWLPL